MSLMSLVWRGHIHHRAYSGLMHLFCAPFFSAMSERCFALSETEVRQGFKRKNPEGMGAKARRFHSTRIHFFLLTHLFAKGGFFSN
jgi:hypothetical protein